MRRSRTAGAAGIRYRSLWWPGSENLVLWRWNDTRSSRVPVIDTLSELPSIKVRGGRYEERGGVSDNPRIAMSYQVWYIHNGDQPHAGKAN